MYGIELLVVFFAAFLAATVIPAQSEAVLVGVAATGSFSKELLLLVASLGNVLGSIVNYILGYQAICLGKKKQLFAKTTKLEKYESIYRRYGVWTLLFAWLPLVGDVFTVLAGVFRANIWVFILLVTIGKAGRYWLLLYFV
jgi:membrane protein YqaA with SNARE-associated domain